MSKELLDFFRQKKQRAEAENAGIDWASRKSEWLDAIAVLYGRVNAMLSDAVSQGTVTIEPRKKLISEDHLGEYEVDELVLLVGDERVVFSPKGRNVVGAAGRVDVQGERGEAMLVLQPGPRWSVVKSKYPQLRVVELTDASLAETLRGVMRQ